MANQILREVRQRHGNHLDRTSRCIFARWWGLGILSLSQELAPPEHPDHGRDHE
jgi:hypothetical protein